MTDDTEPVDVESILDEMVRLGHAEEGVDKNGVSYYRLTKAGVEEGRKVIRRAGFDPETLRPEDMDKILGLPDGRMAENLDKWKKEPRGKSVFEEPAP